MSNKDEINKVKAQDAEKAKIAEIAKLAQEANATETPEAKTATPTPTTEAKPKKEKATTYGQYKAKYNKGFWLFFAKNNADEIEKAMIAKGIQISDNDLRQEANKKYYGILENALNFKFTEADNTLTAVEKVYVSADKLNADELQKAILVMQEKMALLVLQAQQAKTVVTQETPKVEEITK